MKPQLKTRQYYDYNECAQFIEPKLGYKIRDTLGKFRGNINAEYRDWWHFLIREVDVHNGCFIQIDSSLLDAGNDWQNEITQVFISEFGEDSDYYVEW